MMARKVFDPESIKPAWVAWVEILKRLEGEPTIGQLGEQDFRK
jgi:hypothetical protein